jgi:oligopeptide/dipeptide ABC transporter ATP-binding protein
LNSACRAILTKPAHPYTRGLIACLPDISTDLKRLPSIPGNTPNPIDLPGGCTFHPRCKDVMDTCLIIEPSLVNIAGVHKVACHLYDMVGADRA